MKKIQPKIFLDTEIPLTYTLTDGYSIGQIIHFNDTGNEFYHKLDGVWGQIGAVSKDPVIINFTEPGVFDILSTYDIIITNGISVNLWLPLISNVVDGKQIIFKNENSTNVSNILSLDGDAQIEDLGNSVPYQIPANSSITLIANRTSNKWDIISEYNPPKDVIQETPTGATDSVNTEFVLSKEPRDIFNLQVYEDTGIAYVVSYFDANTIYLFDTPGSHITCRYIAK